MRECAVVSFTLIPILGFLLLPVGLSLLVRLNGRSAATSDRNPS